MHSKVKEESLWVKSAGYESVIEEIERKFVINYIFPFKVFICSSWSRYEDILISTPFLLCRHDIIAQIYYARRLANKLYPMARMVDLHGGHLVSHERTEEVPYSL